MESKKTIKSPPILIEILGTYTILSLVAFLIIPFAHKKPWQEIFSLSQPHLSLYDLSLTILLSVGVLALLSYVLELSFSVYKKQKEFHYKLLGSIPFLWAILLSFVVAVAEECFFRGALQPLVGISLTCSVVFLLHFMTTLKLSIQGAYEVVKTLLLGHVFQMTENIYPLILIHFILNLIYFAQHFHFFREVKHSPLED